jgi:hypothetical protein
MGKKYRYEIILNGGETVCEPLVYTYSKTPGIELHISPEKARIAFYQGVKHEPVEVLTSGNHLWTDAMKKVMLMHLLRYAKPLDIVNIDVTIDGISCSIFSRKKEDLPLIFSMADVELDHRFPGAWQDKNVINTILNTPKTKYDGRMNAVIALIIAKSKKYYCEKSLYLWMSMNGFYNYIAEQYCDITGKNLKKETKKQDIFCEAMQLHKTGKGPKDEQKEVFVSKALAKMYYLNEEPENLYDKIEKGEETGLSTIIQELQTEYEIDIDPMHFLTIWLPYQVRCNYFHANKAMPLFMYADEHLLKALTYTNYFVERYIEEHLPDWLSTRELTDEKKILLNACGNR